MANEKTTDFDCHYNKNRQDDGILVGQQRNLSFIFTIFAIDLNILLCDLRNAVK